MKLLELKGENASYAKSALKLVELNARGISETDTHEAIEIFETENHVEIIKGLCLIVSIIASSLCGGTSPAPLFTAIRKSTDAAYLAGNDTEANYAVLNLLDATLGHGGSFYLQVYSLKEPFAVILGLTTLFQTLVSSSGRDIGEVTDYLGHMIEERL